MHTESSASKWLNNQNYTNFLTQKSYPHPITIMKENIQILPNDNSDTVSMTSSSSKKKMSTFDKLQNMMLSTTINGKKNNNKGNAMVTSSASISSDKFVDCDDDHYWSVLSEIFNLIFFVIM